MGLKTNKKRSRLACICQYPFRWRLISAKILDELKAGEREVGCTLNKRSPLPHLSPVANRASNARLNAWAASALSITIKSLSCRLRPDVEKFAAPVCSNHPFD